MYWAVKEHGDGGGEGAMLVLVMAMVVLLLVLNDAGLPGVANTDMLQAALLLYSSPPQTPEPKPLILFSMRLGIHADLQLQDWDKFVPGFVGNFAKGYLQKSGGPQVALGPLLGCY